MPPTRMKDSADRPLVEFGNFLGINNIDDPSLIGPRYLQQATNVDVHLDGRILRKSGFTLVSANADHSLWNNKDKTICLYMHAQNLMRLNPDESATLLASGFTVGAKMSYCDADARVFLTNKHEIGFVRDNEYTSTFTESLDAYKVYPIPGNMIEYGHGRLWVVRGDKVFYSDGSRPAQFDLKNNFMRFKGPITLFRCVTYGIWVADGQIQFLSGTNPKGDMRPIVKADFDAIPGTDCLVNGIFLAHSLDDKPVMWLSKKGLICVGGVDGSFHNITDKKYKSPPGMTGAALYMDQNNIRRYISTLRS